MKQRKKVIRMSDTNLASHPDHVPIGPCVLGLMNEVTDHLVLIGKVDNITFDKLDPVNVFMTETVSGQNVNTKGQPTFCGYQVTGRFKELLDPNTAYLAMKNCGTPVQQDDCTIRTAVEDYTAYKGRCIKLLHKSGFYSTDALPGPATMAGVAGGAGGTIGTDTYTFVGTCMYGSTESDYTESDPLPVVLGEVVTLTITPPVGINPDSYKIYVYSIGATTRASSNLVLTIVVDPIDDEFAVVFNELPRTGETYPGDATGSFTVTDSEGTEYTVNDDFTIDISCGIVCFPTAGDIGEGERITITYTYRTNPYVSMSIGPSDTLPPYAHVVLVALKNDDRADIRPRGFEIELRKVLASSGWSWDMSTLTFESGFDFTWEVLMSEHTLNHGTITLHNRHLESYDLSNFAALTEWANGPGCEDVES